ncbi:MAG: hypothetical protein COC24_010245 [Alphaproteobacteria bacterium]|nr:hypothetical protein [Alphaproteobacteria bacterium]
MTNPKTNLRGKGVSPFSLRLTFEERAILKRNAGSMTLSAYIKSQIFPDNAAKYKKNSYAPKTSAKRLSQLLAKLGSSNITNNINVIASEINSGTLLFDEDIKSNINQACIDIQDMRILLMQGLGMKLSQPLIKTTSEFTKASNNGQSL